MNHKMLACLSESHFKDFLLSEITFFLVFESVQNCVKRIIEWVQRKRNQFTRSKEYNSKIKIFFAGNSGIIEITSCDQLHRKKLPEIIFVRWVTHCSHLPRGCLYIREAPYGTLRAGDIEGSDVEPTTLRADDFEGRRL